MICRLNSGLRTCWRVGSRDELLGVDVALEQAALHQRGDAGVDHHRRTAQIGLVAAEVVVEMGLGRLVDEAAEARPAAVGRLVDRAGT
jgi:hypothetical protein